MAKVILVPAGHVVRRGELRPKLEVVPPPRAGTPWTVSEVEKLCKRWHQGISVPDLAVVHQRTPGAIKSQLKRMGITPRRRCG